MYEQYVVLHAPPGFTLGWLPYSIFLPLVGGACQSSRSMIHERRRLLKDAVDLTVADIFLTVHTSVAYDTIVQLIESYDGNQTIFELSRQHEPCRFT